MRKTGVRFCGKEAREDMSADFGFGRQGGKKDEQRNIKEHGGGEKMKQQKLDGDMKRLNISVPKKIDWKIRHLAGNRKTSISRVASELIQESLKREGFLKEDDT